MELSNASEDSLGGKWTRWVAVALVIVMLVSALSVLAGSARSEPVTQSPTAPTVAATSTPVAPTPSATSRTLKIGWIAMAIGTTNPIHITLDDEYVIVYNVYSTLITYDAQYHYKPDIAQKWWVYNATAYEMYLSPDAYWTDPRNPSDTSHHVTGDDVKFSYETYSNNTAQMDLFTDYVREIRNVWVDPTNNLHIIIDFKIPYAPAMETFGTMFILPKYIWQSQTLAWSNPLPIGSGPFMVRPDPAHPDKMLKPPPVLYLDRNPNWHGPKDLGWQIFPNTLEVDSYTTSAAMAQDLVLGVIDTVMSPEPTEWVYYLANKPGITRQSVPHAFVAEVGINLMTPALRATNPQRFRGTNSQLLQNQAVRVALQMSVNRQKMIDNALLGLGSKADTLVPSVSPWHYDFPDYASTMPNWANHSDPRIGPYTADEEFPDNTDAPGTQSSTYLARALLMKEGWKYNSAGAPATLTTTPLCQSGGQNCLIFRFYTLSDVSWWKTAADGMVADAAKAGIQLNLALYGTTQMNNQIWWPMDYDIWLWDWMFTPAADPSTGILSVETCENLVNGTANDNGLCLIDPTTHRWFYDDLFNASVRTTDPVARRALTDQMQSILYQYGGYSLPFYRKEIYAMNEVRWTHWGNWTQNPGLPEDVGLNTLLPGQVWPVDHKPPQVADLPTYTGVKGYPVQFSTAATDPNGIDLTYSWDFDDNADLNHDGLWNNDNEQTAAVALHTYGTAGTYTVTLRVSEVASDPDHWFTQKTTTVTIVDPVAGSPVVSGLSFGPDDPTTLDKWVNFTAAAYDPQGRDLTYSWNFGDGTTAGPFDNPLVTHHFTTAATRTVTVTVASTGGSSEGSTIVKVVENTAPIVSPLQDQQIQEGNLLTLTGFASDANGRDLLNYSWDFGDGATSWLNPATHTYAARGGSPTAYTLTLRVRDIPPFSSGPLHTTTVTAMITVIPRGPDQAPVVTLDASPASGTTTQDITFTITAHDPEGDPLDWSVDFNCANPKQCTHIGWTATTPQTRPDQLLTQTVVHRYTSSGTFYATAFVDDNNKWNVSQQYQIVITMNHAPGLTAISANPASPIPGESVSLSSIASDSDGDVLQYTWNYGDASPIDSGTSAPSGGMLTTSHAYAAEGTYTVLLTVDDGKGGTAQRQLSLSVVQQNRPPTVGPISAPRFALIGATVDFSAHVDDLNGDTLSFSWDWGDSSTPTTGTTSVPAELAAQHVFTAAGDFVVNLSVDDGNGGVDWSVFTITASTAPPKDVTPPVTQSALSGTAGLAGWYTSAVMVTLTATDDMSTIPWTNYSIDSGGWIAYTTPFSIGTDGSHTLAFNSTDSAGNHEAANTVTIKVDRTPPSMADAETGPSVGSWYTGTVEINLTSSDDTSGVATESYRVDGGTWRAYSGNFTIPTEGRHVVDYRVTDVAGLAFSNSVNVNVDLSAPVTTSYVAGTVGNGGWFISTATVSLSATDSFSGVANTYYAIDGGTPTLYTAAFDITAEGAHMVGFYSEDAAGHVEATAYVAVSVDTSPPVTTPTLTGTQSGGWYTSSVLVTLGATDDASGVATTQFSLDGGPWEDYAAGFTLDQEGSHTLRFNSTDSAGNAESTKTSTIDVDMTGPTTMMTLAGTAGTNGWYTSSVSVTLEATDAGSGPGPIGYRVDGGTWDDYTVPFTITGEGTHTVEYNATDVVGNTESVESSTVKIDTVAPSVTATPTGTAGSNGWYRSATVSLGGADDTSGIATLSYRLDGGSWQTYASPVNVPDGTHTFDARSTDNAGLTSTLQTLSLKVDSAPPSTVLTAAGLSGNAGWYKSTVNVTVTANDGTSGIASMEYRVDSGSWQAYASGDVIHVADGEHTVEARSTDNAGWVGPSNSASYRVDTAAPTLSLLGPTGTVTSTSVTVTWTGADAGSGIATYSVTVDGGTPQNVGTANSTTLTLAAGGHTITVTATDVAGNSVSQDFSLTVAPPAGPSGGLETTTIIAIVVVVAAAALGGVWFLMRRRKASPPTIPPEP